MKNEEIYDNSRNAPNGDPSIKTEVKDDKDDSNMNGVRYDCIGKEDKNRRYDEEDMKSKNFYTDSSLNNKLTSTIESENNLNEEYKYGYDNDVLASQEMQTISKIMKSENMICVQNAFPENNLVDTNLLLIEGNESVGINKSESFKSVDNLNTEDKINSNDTEKASDYMYGMKSDSDVRSGSKSFEDKEVHGEKIKTGSFNTLEESSMDGEGRHSYLSDQRGYVNDESVPNQDYGKMQYKEMKEGGKEYLYFDKREKDDRDLSGCRGVDSDFDAVESDINFYDQQDLRLGVQDGSRLDPGGGRSETRNDYQDEASAVTPPVDPQNTLDYEGDQNHYQNYEAQKSVDNFEQEISDALPSPKSEQGEKKSLPNFESNVVKTNGATGIIDKENPTDTIGHNGHSNDSGLYRDDSNACLSDTPCANDSRGADKNGNEKEALDDVTWWGHKNDKEDSSAGSQQAEINIDITAVDKESDHIKGNQSNEEGPPTGTENDNMGSTTRKEGTIDSDSGDQNEGADNATSLLVEIDKTNKDGENDHLAYVGGVETGKEFRSSEQKVGHEKSVKNCANEKGTEDGKNYGEKTGEDVLVKKTMCSAIPSEGSNTEEFYNYVSVSAPVNVENDLGVTRMKSSSDDAEQEGEYDSNVTTLNSPPKEGSRGGSCGGSDGSGDGSGHDDGGDDATKQEQEGLRDPNEEPVRSKDNASEFKVTKLSNTNGKDNKDSLYSYMKGSNAMDDTITSTISDNVNEYELVEDGSEVKNEKEELKIKSENVQMDSAYHTVANNNKRRRDSFTNDEMNKERKLNSQNASLYDPSCASPEENVNKTLIEHVHVESYEEQKEEKTSYESYGKGEQYVNHQQGNQNKPGKNFVSYSKENLEGGVIFVNRDNMISDSSYDNGKTFTHHRTFDKSNVVEKVVQENVDTNGAYVASDPQSIGEDSDANCKENRTHNVNDVIIEDNSNSYSEHIQVSGKSVKDKCDEYADMENENNNLSDDGKNSSDDNMEKKDSTQFDANDKKKAKPDSETLLPIANISRIMKRILPASAKVAKESKDIIRECVTEFIQFLTSEASDRCLRERRKTISGEDILFSMEKLGFNDYVEPLYEYLTKWKQLKGMNNSNNCQEKKCEGSKPPLEENTTMKKSLSDVNMNNNAIMSKGADNVMLTKDTDHLMNNMYRNPNEIFENNINHMY
ncbi:CCAAT-box DNA binding protein subunit B [Plasmodium cynomolgi strain B]|uniref:CCAAT-box DNA binding protein subunit B n=1 Tax=Plasmodium cynomolgi (strain B) TaxID=1120755 RepID=K6UDK0_PLACD|nr:CCAAT-box DNA binding protein subunit B [Plasmodium cynomolgi strain B]GAB66736.1 CCAAT-box DNA binding protein subunit B [Plasmodium cynomolgi strain B]